MSATIINAISLTGNHCIFIFLLLKTRFGKKKKPFYWVVLTSERIWGKKGGFPLISSLNFS